MVSHIVYFVACIEERRVASLHPPHPSARDRRRPSVALCSSTSSLSFPQSSPGRQYPSAWCKLYNLNAVLVRRIVRHYSLNARGYGCPRNAPKIEQRQPPKTTLDISDGSRRLGGSRWLMTKFEQRIHGEVIHSMMLFEVTELLLEQNSLGRAFRPRPKCKNLPLFAESRGSQHAAVVRHYQTLYI